VLKSIGFQLASVDIVEFCSQLTGLFEQLADAVAKPD
jgi:hypothetical protein